MKTRTGVSLGIVLLVVATMGLHGLGTAGNALAQTTPLPGPSVPPLPTDWTTNPGGQILVPKYVAEQAAAAAAQGAASAEAEAAAVAATRVSAIAGAQAVLARVALYGAVAKALGLLDEIVALLDLSTKDDITAKRKEMIDQADQAVKHKKEVGNAIDDLNAAAGQSGQPDPEAQRLLADLQAQQEQLDLACNNALAQANNLAQQLDALQKKLDSLKGNPFLKGVDWLSGKLGLAQWNIGAGADPKGATFTGAPPQPMVVQFPPDAKLLAIKLPAKEASVAIQQPDGNFKEASTAIVDDSGYAKIDLSKIAAPAAITIGGALIATLIPGNSGGGSSGATMPAPREGIKTPKFIEIPTGEDHLTDFPISTREVTLDDLNHVETTITNGNGITYQAGSPDYAIVNADDSLTMCHLADIKPDMKGENTVTVKTPRGEFTTRTLNYAYKLFAVQETVQRGTTAAFNLVVDGLPEATATVLEVHVSPATAVLARAPGAITKVSPGVYEVHATVGTLAVSPADFQVDTTSVPGQQVKLSVIMRPTIEDVNE